MNNIYTYSDVCKDLERYKKLQSINKDKTLNKFFENEIIKLTKIKEQLERK